MSSDTPFGMPELPSDWTWKALSELSKRVSVGHVGETSSVFCEKEGVIFLRSQNVRPGKIDLHDVKFVTKEFHEKSKKSQLKAGDILIVRVGQNRGDCAVVPEGLGELNCANIVFSRPQKKYSEFLGYFFNSPLGRAALLAVSTGSAQGVLNTKSIAKIPVPVPPEDVAENIGKYLKTFDKKIELNHQINQTIEAIVQAIFKSWFVDFEPVKAKMSAIEAGENAEGVTRASMTAISGKTDEELDQLEADQPEHYTQLKTTAELFPSAMQDSELGLIPKGWRVGDLGEFASISSGKRPKQKFDCKNIEFNVPLIGASSIVGYVNEILYKEPVLVIGRVGTLGIIQRIFQPSYPSDNTLVIRSKYYEYIYQMLNLIDYGSLNVGSTQPLITQTSIIHSKVIISDCPLLDIFEKISASMFSKINLNNTENQSLSYLRDSLLPKLLFGELEVNDVDKMES